MIWAIGGLTLGVVLLSAGFDLVVYHIRRRRAMRRSGTIDLAEARRRRRRA